MGIASLIIGIVSLILSFIPFCNFIIVLPTIAGIIFGIVDITKNSQREEKSSFGILGIILNIIALVLSVMINILYVIMCYD